VKVGPREVERFLRAPNDGIRAVLVYGPDEGLVRERAAALVRAVAETPDDPFRVAIIAGAKITADPAALPDEAAALSLTGGRRVVRVRDAGNDHAEAFAALLDNPACVALVVAEAGDLPARSALRKAFESAAAGAALACYRDDAKRLPALIEEALGAHGLRASPEAARYLAYNLGGDRQVSRRELEKLALYVGPDGGPVELEDARACVGDSAALSLEDVAFAVAGGNGPGLERALVRGFDEGANPVQALRAVGRHVLRLHLANALMGAGMPFESAARRLRPAPFWKVKARFEAQARGWSGRSLSWALGRLLDAELACKRTGAPAHALCARALSEIAYRAPRSARERGH